MNEDFKFRENDFTGEEAEKEILKEEGGEKPFDETQSVPFGAQDKPADFEVEPEIGEVSQKEIRMPHEHTIIADREVMKSALGEALEEADPEGDSSIVMIEFVDEQISSRSASHGLDFVEDLAERGDLVIVTGWQRRADYASDPRWHAAMAYPNVHFARLPFSLEQVKGIIETAKAEPTRPEDPLAKRLPKISRDLNQIGSLEHNLKHAVAGGMFAMQEWEAKAREIFGDELALDEIIERIKKKDNSSIEGELAGESFPDLCVDIEDTLIREGEIDQELVAKLIEEAKEQPITIWTGGDLEHYDKVLRKAGITFKLVSKYWMRGAKVTRAIDNMPYEEFREKYGVEVEEYTQIKE